MIKYEPIIITGIPRSGASMIAGVINRCGAFGGNMTNHRGIHENDRVKELLESSYLNYINADELGQYPLPSDNDIHIPVKWKEHVESIFIQDGYKGGEWFYKSSKATLLWKIWNNAFPHAKWVIVRRRSADIVESCIKTGYMKAFKNPKIRQAIGVDSESAGWLWMIHEYEKRFVEMISSGLNCKVVYPERLVYGDYSQLYETLEWLRLRWSSDVFSYIDPLLETTRRKEKEVKNGSTGNR